MEDIYPISEDTLLILKNIKCGSRVLEMGTGNGEIALYCAQKGSEITAADIDINALEHVKKEAKKHGVNIEVVYSDLFENIKGKYTTIIFNPPYLPGDPNSLKDLQWAGGGRYGDLIILRFLEDAIKYLEDDGEIYLVLSSFNRLDYIKELPYEFYLVDKLKLSFHEIYLYKLKKKIKTQ